MFRSFGVDMDGPRLDLQIPVHPPDVPYPEYEQDLEEVDDDQNQ